jgi:hypothetical protein
MHCDSIIGSDLEQSLSNGGWIASIEAFMLTEHLCACLPRIDDVSTFADDGPANKQDPGLQSTVDRCR